MFDESGFEFRSGERFGGAGVSYSEPEGEVDPFLHVIGTQTGHLPATGIRALMLAVLEDGIRCYFSATRRVRMEAEHWIDSNLQRTAFSFPVLCEMFGVEPAAARRALRRLRDGESAHVMPRRRRRAVRHALAA